MFYVSLFIWHCYCYTQLSPNNTKSEYNSTASVQSEIKHKVFHKKIQLRDPENIFLSKKTARKMIVSTRCILVNKFNYMKLRLQYIYSYDDLVFRNWYTYMTVFVCGNLKNMNTNKETSIHRPQPQLKVGAHQQKGHCYKAPCMHVCFFPPPRCSFQFLYILRR